MIVTEWIEILTELILKVMKPDIAAVLFRTPAASRQIIVKAMKAAPIVTAAVLL